MFRTISPSILSTYPLTHTEKVSTAIYKDIFHITTIKDTAKTFSRKLAYVRRLRKLQQ
jgi:hypothetical protein